MKALLLDGSLNYDFEMIYALISEELKRNGFEVDSILLRDIKVASCQGCFDCWLKSPGECKIDDYGQKVAEKMVHNFYFDR